MLFLKNLQQKRPFVLGSSSPRRKHLLSDLGVDFSIRTPQFEEKFSPKDTISSYPLRNAKGKGQAILEELCKEKTFDEQETFILTADTIVTIDSQLLEKPSDHADAVRMLSLLAGRTHQVLTGVVLLIKLPKQNHYLLREETFTTEVTFKKLQRDEIEAYIATQEPFDKAGSYALQGHGAFLVKSTKGSPTNVIGLPVAEVCDWLQDAFTAKSYFHSQQY